MNATITMTTRTALLWLLTICPTLLLADASGDARQLDRLFSKSQLQIATPDARLHTFRVWVADDDARRARGLMHVRALADDSGMLFIYGAERPVAMWMKNTFIPLDMLFVRADGRVARVVENAEPLSLDTIESGEPVVAVIELGGGIAGRLKIKPGAQIIHPVFRNTTR